MRRVLPKPYIHTLLFTLVLLLGAMVMLGWLLKIPALVQVLPTLSPMQFNNALCFLIFGLCGIFYTLNWKTPYITFIVLGLLLSGLTFIQYPLGIDFGIDQLLMKEESVVQTAHPGRMAPNSAIGHFFAFLSFFLLSIGKPFYIRSAGWAGALVLGAGIVSLSGYIIDPTGGYSWGLYTQMALHTSLGFILSGAALGFTVIPKRMRIEKSRFNLWPYQVILMAMVFFIDLQIPQGVAVGLLYFIPVMVSWFFRDRKNILIVAGIANALIVLDIIFATESFEREAVIFNQVMSIINVWVAAAIFYYLKTSVQKRQEADTKFKLAVKGTTAGIWEWMDVSKDKEWWSPTFYELLGYKNEEIEASLQTFAGLLHPDDKEATFKLVDEHFEKKKPFVIEYRLKHKSGQYKWFLGSGQAIWDDDDQPKSMVGTIINIHPKKAAEQAERERAAQLEKKNKELEELTYITSHDLQEPVRTIASFSELLAQEYYDQLDEEGRQYLDFIKQSSERSQELIVDLLEYNRIGADSNMQEVNLEKLVEGVLTDLSILIQQKHAQINIDKLPLVKGHPTELRLLLQNLISNAIKFHQPGTSPEISLRTQKQNGYCTIAIKDNGIGIDQKHLDLIFVIFKRLHSRNDFEGTGIGLAHCKKIVEHHGGKIWVESTIGEGSTFYFTIPVSEA